MPITARAVTVFLFQTLQVVQHVDTIYTAVSPEVEDDNFAAQIFHPQRTTDVDPG